MRNAFADPVVEEEVIILDGAFKAVIFKALRVALFHLAQLQVMRGNHTQTAVFQQMGNELTGTGQLIGRIGAL